MYPIAMYISYSILASWIQCNNYGFFLYWKYQTPEFDSLHFLPLHFPTRKERQKSLGAAIDDINFM